MRTRSGSSAMVRVVPEQVRPKLVVVALAWLE
jgi:hypothetical protein